MVLTDLIFRVYHHVASCVFCRLMIAGWTLYGVALWLVREKTYTAERKE